MPPPPPPTNLYPCLDWIPLGVAKSNPKRLKLSKDELKGIISEAKSKALEARNRLGQATLNEQQHLNNNQATVGNSPSSITAQQTEDDVIMREYGLEDYDDDDEDNEALDGIQPTDGQAEMSEDDADNDQQNTTGGTIPINIASDMATLTYHASNEDDPYLSKPGDASDDDKEDENELIIKPTDNLIVTGHVSKDESSIEVYVYDNETNDLYLHHDIIQGDYPCCVRWVGHARHQARNIAAAGYMSPDILLWDLDVVDVLEPMERLVGHKDAVIDISWNNQTKNIIASGSADKHVRIWDLNECKSISNIKLPGKVSALEFGIYEQFLLLAGDLNKNISLIDTRSNTIVNKWSLNGEVERVRWIPADHSKFLVSDDLGYVYYFDLCQASDRNQATIKFKAHEISITGLEFSPQNDDMLVTASADDTIKVWDTKKAFRKGASSASEPTLIKKITDLKVGRILSLRMCPNSLGLVAVGGDSKCNSFKTYDLTSEPEGKSPNLLFDSFNM